MSAGPGSRDPRTHEINAMIRAGEIVDEAQRRGRLDIDVLIRDPEDGECWITLADLADRVDKIRSR